MKQTSLIARSPAKINLTLDVLGLRADGYHELRSVVHTIGLYDTIRFNFGGAGLRFTCDKSELCGDDNLCLKAARLWEIAANRVLDCEIELHKTIPTGAGLGGGSGNAAATLLALNRHFDEVLSEVGLAEIAANLGADVPLFLRGGCSLIEGIGERIAPLRAIEGWIAVFQGARKLSTPQVFRAFDDLKLSSENASPAFLKSLERNAALHELASSLQNDLTPAAARCGVDVEPHLEKLRELGALGATMTGSGSAFYGVFDSETKAQKALQNMEYHYSQQNDIVHFAAVAPFSSRGIEWK